MSASPRRIKTALIQARSSADPQENLGRALRQVRKAAENGAQMICLQELYQTNYFCQFEDEKYFDLAETIPGPSTESFSKLAKELQIVIIVPVFEKRAPGLYHNSAVILDADGRMAGMYRKMHLPHDPHFYEKFYFAPGDLGFRTFQTRFAKIGLLICWDQWFPEAARVCALQSAEILFYPSAIGWLDTEPNAQRDQQLQNWKLMHQAHAVANGIFVAAVNRAGKEKDLDFWGNSMVVNPFGQMIAQGSGDEQIVTAVCDFSEIETARRQWPFLRDRRFDAYGSLVSSFADAPKK